MNNLKHYFPSSPPQKNHMNKDLKEKLVEGFEEDVFMLFHDAEEGMSVFKEDYKDFKRIFSNKLSSSLDSFEKELMEGLRGKDIKTATEVMMNLREDERLKEIKYLAARDKELARVREDSYLQGLKKAMEVAKEVWEIWKDNGSAEIESRLKAEIKELEK